MYKSAFCIRRAFGTERRYVFDSQGWRGIASLLLTTLSLAALGAFAQDRDSVLVGDLACWEQKVVPKQPPTRVPCGEPIPNAGMPMTDTGCMLGVLVDSSAAFPIQAGICPKVPAARATALSSANQRVTSLQHEQDETILLLNKTIAQFARDRDKLSAQLAYLQNKVERIEAELATKQSKAPQKTPAALSPAPRKPPQ